MKNDNPKIGISGENAAVSFLEKNGYQIIERNYKKKMGEIDIVGIDDGEYVFIEVKSSKYHPYSSFSPEFRVGKKKLNSIAGICEIYCLEHKFRSKQSWRVDVISVLLDSNYLPVKIEQFKNILFK